MQGFNTFEEQDKVLVALSGGINSCAAVRILQEQGFKVFGAVLCTDEDTVAAARAANDKLGIDLVEIQIPEGWEDTLAARIELFVKLAEKLNCKYASTGHYARVEMDRDGSNRLLPCACKEDDQSHLLKEVESALLEKLTLPLGWFSRADIAEMATAIGL